MVSNAATLGAIVLVLVVASLPGGCSPLVEKVLLKHDPDAKGVFRWSEASTINLDGKQHLMMLVTAFGFGGHYDTVANILEFHSHDGGLSWTPLEEAAVFQENIGSANIQAPSLLRLDNDNLLCFFLVRDKALEDMGTWVRRSTDNGKTWSEPERLPYEGYGGLSSDRACLPPPAGSFSPVG